MAVLRIHSGIKKRDQTSVLPDIPNKWVWVLVDTTTQALVGTATTTFRNQSTPLMSASTGATFVINSSNTPGEEKSPRDST